MLSQVRVEGLAFEQLEDEVIPPSLRPWLSRLTTTSRLPSIAVVHLRCRTRPVLTCRAAGMGRGDGARGVALDKMGAWRLTWAQSGL